MKVTAILPDELIKDVKKYSKGKTLTESLRKALEEWNYQRRLANVRRKLDKWPGPFMEGFSAEKTRELNRRQRW